MKFNKKLIVGKRIISKKHPTYFIADIAANHDGNLSKAKDLIWLAKDSGADAVKFQHFLAEKIVSDYGFKKLGKMAHQKKWSSNVFDVYKKYSFNRKWNNELIKTAKKAGIDFFTTPYDYEAVNEINKYVKLYKIGSGDITWLEFIKFISKKGKPVLLATGASNVNDVIRAIKVITKFNKKICVMQCNTNYTASLDNFKFINLNVLRLFKKKFPNIILGLSDHTPGHTTVLGAISLGARIIEKHFTYNNNKKGPDHLFSMNPKTWKEMIERTRELEISFGTGIKKVEQNEKSTFMVQRRSIHTHKKIKKNQILKKKDLICLRPYLKNSLHPYEMNKIIGKKTKKNYEKGEIIFWKDLK